MNVGRAAVLTLGAGFQALTWSPAWCATPPRIPVEIQISLPAEGVSVAGLTCRLTYPKAQVSLPGVGAASEVRERIELLQRDDAKDDLMVVNNQADDGTLRVVYARQPADLSSPMTPGAFVRISFDATAALPSANDFTCQVGGASDATGRKLEGVTCSATLGKP